MTDRFNRHTLLTARQLRGLSQKQLSSEAGVSQALVSKFENGLLSPDESLVKKFGRVLSFPSSFFYETDPAFGLPVSVHTRKKASVGKREMNRALAEFNIRVGHIRRMLEATDLTSDLELPFLDISEYGDNPEHIADLMRRVWLAPSGPLDNLTGFMERAGAIIVWCDLSRVAIDGVTFKIPGLPPLVFADETQTADRMRFTLAHELGHLVMHRWPTPNMEKEANEFASALLMPGREIRSALSGRVTLARLAQLKPVWKVSIQSLLMRAQSVGTISSNQARYLWVQINRLGIRKREPPELDIEFEHPTVVHDLVQLHLRELGYSLAEFAAALHMDEHEFASWYRLEPSQPSLRLLD